MSPDQILIAAIRITNFLLWLDLGFDVLRHSQMLPPLTRRLIVLVIVGGMGVLVIGAFAPTYVPPDLARNIYTAYTGFAAIIALAIRRTWKHRAILDAGSPGR